MALDPRIILAGQPSNPGASFAEGVGMSQNMRANEIALGDAKDQSQRQRDYMEARRALALIDRAQTPELWDQIASKVAPDLVGQFGKRDAIRAAVETTIDALDPRTPDEPKVMKGPNNSIVQLIPNGKGGYEINTLLEGQRDESALETRARLAGLQPGTPEFQQFMLSGGAGEGSGEKRYNVGGRLVDSSGNVVYEPPAEEKELPVDDEGKLRKEFNALTDDFRKVDEAYRRIVASAENPSAAGDLALIFNYMKVLDPGSVVRESEFATAQNAAGVPARIRAQYNQVLRGERLADEQRADFVNRASMLYEAAREGFAARRDQYREIATQYGFDPARAVPDATAAPSLPGIPPDVAESLRGRPPGTTIKAPNGQIYEWDGQRLQPKR